MNIVICGESGSGKSTAIGRILQQLDEPVYGFQTKKLPPNFDGRAPVYIRGCQEPLRYREDHKIGTCKNRCAEKFPGVFDTVGAKLLENIPKGALVLLDEIGVMENDAKLFQKRIFELLDGDYRLLVAVRDLSTPLLDAIRNHPKTICRTAQEANTPEFIDFALSVLRKE